MSEEPMHRIIKLKRYEKPPEGYFDDFLKEFHKRQRMELLKPSLFTLFKERLTFLLEEMRVPALGYAGAAAVATIACFAIVRLTPAPSGPTMRQVSYSPGTAPLLIPPRAQPVSFPPSTQGILPFTGKAPSPFTPSPAP
jgi:hypothetical protein